MKELFKAIEELKECWVQVKPHIRYKVFEQYWESSSQYQKYEDGICQLGEFEYTTDYDGCFHDYIDASIFVGNAYGESDSFDDEKFEEYFKEPPELGHSNSVEHFDSNIVIEAVLSDNIDDELKNEFNLKLKRVARLSNFSWQIFI